MNTPCVSIRMLFVDYVYSKWRIQDLFSGEKGNENLEQILHDSG